MERFFSLLAVAFLGLAALALAPEEPRIHAESDPILEEVGQEPSRLEIETITEVDAINSGQFVPYQTGQNTSPDSSHP